MRGSVTCPDMELVSFHFALLSQSLTLAKGSHTDYGLMALLAQDSSGGLRVPSRGGANQSREEEENIIWRLIPPVNDCLIMFPGYTMSPLTFNHVPATSHKVALGSSERFSIVQFHEPHFDGSK
jgi:isopenicillin N synthase-like dioxygenase